MSAPMYLPTFYVKQKFAMTTNKYSLFAANPDGSFGQLMGVAEQKRLAFKEQVTFYSDETKSRPVFGFKARQRMDLAATYDVTDATGTPIGSFRKEFKKSLLRSTWQLTATDGLQATGTERNQNVAIARRLWEMVPIVSELPSPFLFTSTSPHRTGRSC